MWVVGNKRRKKAKKKKERQGTGGGAGCKAPFPGCCLLSQEAESLQKKLWSILGAKAAKSDAQSGAGALHCADTRGVPPAAIQPSSAGNQFCLQDPLHQVRGICMWGFGMSGGLQTSEMLLIQTTSCKDFDYESCKQLLPLERSECA